jgi:hypothetical protein
MSIPVALQGKQGKCPACSSVVTITANAPASPSTSPQHPQQQHPQQCPHYGSAGAISGVQAGAQVKCGVCAKLFIMPQHQPVQHQPVQHRLSLH